MDAAVASAAEEHETIPLPRRDAEVVLQLGALREWLQDCLGFALPPGDLPTILQDGKLLCTLGAKLQNFEPPPVGATATECIEAFARACHHVGVERDRVLHPDHLLLPGPRRSATGLVQALTALADAASARGLLPALR